MKIFLIHGEQFEYIDTLNQCNWITRLNLLRLLRRFLKFSKKDSKVTGTLQHLARS